MEPYRGPPMTLGIAAAAGVRLIVWCKECRHQVEPEMATRYGTETPVLDWRERLLPSPCGSRQVDMVVRGIGLRARCAACLPMDQAGQLGAEIRCKTAE